MVLPFVRELFADVELSPEFARLTTHLKSNAGRIRVSGLTPTAKSLYLPLLQRAAGRPLFVIVADNRAAEDMQPIVQSFCELTGACPPDSVVRLPAHDVLPFENLSPHAGILEARAVALWKIATGAASIVLVPVAAAAMRVRDAQYYAGLARTLRRGDMVELEPLVQHLNVVGYGATDVVEMPGQYASRGGILDVYPPESDRPLRIEFFGDEIESIRKFDPESQRSTTAVDDIVLLPLTDTPVSEDVLAAVHERLSRERVAGTEAARERALVEAGVTVFPGWEMYAPVAGETGCVFDLLPRAAVVVNEPSSVDPELDEWWEKVVQRHEESLVGNLVRPEELAYSADELKALIAAKPGTEMEQLGIARGEILQTSFRSQPTTRFHGSVPAMIEEIKRLTSESRRVLFAAPNQGELERLAEIFSEYGIPFRMGSRAHKAGDSHVDESSLLLSEAATTTVVKTYVPEGVALPDQRLVLFGSSDLFDESEIAAARPQKQKSKTAAFLSDFRDLAVGDYVVHVEHGIGQYQGLKEITSGDGAGEFMILEYAESARLYVPLTRLDLVQKYRSAEGGPPPQLSRLGTQAWTKTKAKVKKAMRDMADELLKLYAQRKMARGHAYATDTEWQREFEEGFEHNETEDQEQAVLDIKVDMESPQPMDRLLCGDVGYGKTEVAMRATFKAVSDNKQVAVLAPTTVLAFQHFETFKRRFAAFPIAIEMISRFRTTKQQKEIVGKVETGKVDVLIGTHRLLSKDIKFPDLGLVVVDEEQRFGVAHKERLKKLKKEVDVLTMSATPIPRTLHMSLVGLRDMSVIETPPRDRMAIQTVVAAWDDKLIRAALEHELERGGQIYFVHNRVDSIYEIADKIRELAPKARILVGHGQMGEGELEKIMLTFMRHEADILLATTIIENGLDIPLCNTMVINRADRHGLSELYQLRGRVGRSNRKAYAYLLVPTDAELTPLARRRLAALKEFSDLGAGFKIAALDLELRGAGNLLGGEQSGHIDAVGFELYTSMLERTVKELKGEVAPEEIEVQLNLGINIRIPNEYIPEENQRLRMYKRVAGVESEKALADVSGELRDRYGDAPPPVRHLLEYAALKLQCRRMGVTAIERRRELVSVRFAEKAAIDPERLMKFVASHKGAQFTPQGMLKFTMRATTADDVLRVLRELMHQIAARELAEGEPTLAR